MAMPRLWILAATIGIFWFLFQGPDARADVWNKKTKVTFSGPVELPGGVVLQSGDYVLKLMDSPADRHIVQVFNTDGNHVYATILAIPNYRLEPAGKTVITFYETPEGQPKFIRAWFYPGDNFGQEFAYPKERATYLAKTTGTNVPVEPANKKEEGITSAMSPKASEVALNNNESADSTAPAEITETAEAAQVTAPPSAQSSSAQPDSAQPSQDDTGGQKQTPGEASQLPKTGSNLPLLGLTGLLSLVSALGVRLLASRRSS